MEEALNIFNTIDYHINKGFHRIVKGPLSYLIKVVGIDCESKPTSDLKTKVCKDQTVKKPNEKYTSLIVMFFLLKTLRRRRIRKELKKKRYEEVEQAV